MKFLIIPFFVLMLQTSAFGQEKINWISFEEAIVLNKQFPKKIIVDIYTNWCGWCKKMDNTTFSDPDLVNYINENFYAVKFDADQKTTIKYNDIEYKYRKNGRKGYHELAAFLLQGKLSFPSFVFIDERNNVIQPLASYMDAIKFKMVATYFAQNQYKSTPWSKFAKRYRKLHNITK